MARIIDISVKRRHCGECEHAFLGSTGVWCPIYSEHIWDEYVAEDCEMFDPIEKKEAEIVGLTDRRK